MYLVFMLAVCLCFSQTDVTSSNTIDVMTLEKCTLRLESQEILNQTVFFLIMQKEGESGFKISLPYDTVAIERLETFLDGYGFYGSVRFSPDGELYKFFLRTNSYGTPIRFLYPDINILPISPLHTVREIGSAFVEFEWKPLASYRLTDFSFWLGKEPGSLSLVATNLEQESYTLDAGKYFLSGRYYWKVEGLAYSGERVESPISSFNYALSPFSFAGLDVFTAALASHTTELSNVIIQSRDTISEKIDTTLSDQNKEYKELLERFRLKTEEIATHLKGLTNAASALTQTVSNGNTKLLSTLTSISAGQTDILSQVQTNTAILSPSTETILDCLSTDTENCVGKIYEAERFLSDTQKVSILDSLYAYSTDSATSNQNVISVFYDLIVTLPPLKQLAAMERFLPQGEATPSWLFTGGGAIDKFSKCVGFLAGSFSNEIPFCFAPYRTSIEKLKKIYLTILNDLREERAVVDPTEVFYLSEGLRSVTRAKYYLDFHGLGSEFIEYRRKGLSNNNKNIDTVMNICNTMEYPYNYLVSMNHLVSVYSGEQLAKGLFEDLYVGTTGIDDFAENEGNPNKEQLKGLSGNYGTVFGYTLGWWELVWANINNNNNPNDNLKKSYNAFKILFEGPVKVLFEKPVIVDATPTALENLNNLRVTLIGNPTGQATETYELHEDYTVKAAYGFLKTIEYIYEKKQNESYGGQISTYREALIRYLYKKSEFASADDFVKKVQSYAFETPVSDSFIGTVKDIFPDTDNQNNSEAQKAQD